jgi:hypothetical protein
MTAGHTGGTRPTPRGTHLRAYGMGPGRAAVGNSRCALKTYSRPEPSKRCTSMSAQAGTRARGTSPRHMLWLTRLSRRVTADRATTAA